MDKISELSKKQKNDEKILIANVLDKINHVKTRNNYENTFFLDLSQQFKVEKMLQLRKFEDYEFFGGFEKAERKMLFIFSDKIFNYEEDKNEIYNKAMSIINLKLTKEQYGQYEHKTYLGALIKLGIKREMIGDIIVKNEGAEIIISSEVEKYVMSNLKLLTRFQKSEIEKINIEDINYIAPKTKIVNIIVPSMRLDAIVSELAKCSRSEAQELIEQERVFVNFNEELVCSKRVEINSFISIRGKGRFKILNEIGKTKHGNLNIEVEVW